MQNESYSLLEEGTEIVANLVNELKDYCIERENKNIINAKNWLKAFNRKE